MSLASSSSPGAGVLLLEQPVELFEDLQFVGDRLFDVDALDATAVVGQSVQRYDHVLVDLEGVGVRRDRGGARTVEPEALARLGTDGDEALALARIGQAHELGGRRGDRLFVVRDQVGDQDHLRAFAPCGLGRVTHRLDVAFVEVLQAGDLHLRQGLGVVDDLDDRRYRLAQVGAEELQAHGAHMLGHAMQHEAGRGDQAVAALFLHAGQTGEKLVGDVLAEPGLAKDPAGHLQDLRFFLSACGRPPRSG